MNHGGITVLYEPQITTRNLKYQKRLTIRECICLLFVLSGFQWMMLAGIRALAEQQPIDEDYSKFK